MNPLIRLKQTGLNRYSAFLAAPSFRVLIGILVLAMGRSASADCDSVYKYALAVAHVKDEQELYTKSRNYLKNEQTNQTNSESKFDLAVKNVGLHLGKENSKISGQQEEMEKNKELYWARNLYYVDSTFQTKALELYNSCLESKDWIDVRFQCLPGDKEGTVRIKTLPTNLTAMITSLHKSHNLTFTDDALKKGKKIENAEIGSDFKLTPVESAWVLVETSSGPGVGALWIPPPPQPSTTIRTVQTTVPANREGWTDSTTLNEFERATVTVDPQHSQWVVHNHQSASYQGLDSRANGKYFARGLVIGSLVVKCGKNTVTGFGPGISVLNFDGPGTISFACNDVVRPPPNYPHNQGSVEAVVQVFSTKLKTAKAIE